MCRVLTKPMCLLDLIVHLVIQHKKITDDFRYQCWLYFITSVMWACGVYAVGNDCFNCKSFSWFLLLKHIYFFVAKCLQCKIPLYVESQF